MNRKKIKKNHTATDQDDHKPCHGAALYRFSGSNATATLNHGFNGSGSEQSTTDRVARKPQYFTKKHGVWGPRGGNIQASPDTQS